MFVPATAAFGNNHRWNIWGFCVLEASPRKQRKAWRPAPGPGSAPSRTGASLAFPLTLRDARVPGSVLLVWARWASRSPSSWTARLWKGSCPAAARNFARAVIHDNGTPPSRCRLGLGSDSCPLLVAAQGRPLETSPSWGRREEGQPKPSCFFFSFLTASLYGLADKDLPVHMRSWPLPIPRDHRCRSCSPVSGLLPLFRASAPFRDPLCPDLPHGCGTAPHQGPPPQGHPPSHPGCGSARRPRLQRTSPEDPAVSHRIWRETASGYSSAAE